MTNDEIKSEIQHIYSLDDRKNQMAFIRAYEKKGVAAFFDLPDEVILDGTKVKTANLFRRHCQSRWIDEIVGHIK